MLNISYNANVKNTSVKYSNVKKLYIMNAN